MICSLAKNYCYTTFALCSFLLRNTMLTQRCTLMKARDICTKYRYFKLNIMPSASHVNEFGVK